VCYEGAAAVSLIVVSMLSRTPLKNVSSGLMRNLKSGETPFAVIPVRKDDRFCNSPRPSVADREKKKKKIRENGKAKDPTARRN